MHAASLLLTLALAACASCRSNQHRDLLRTGRSGPSGDATSSGETNSKAAPTTVGADKQMADRQARIFFGIFCTLLFAGITSGGIALAENNKDKWARMGGINPPAEHAAANAQSFTNAKLSGKEVLWSRISDAVDSLRMASDDGNSDTSIGSKDHVVDDLVNKALKVAANTPSKDHEIADLMSKALKAAANTPSKDHVVADLAKKALKVAANTSSNDHIVADLTKVALKAASNAASKDKVIDLAKKAFKDALQIFDKAAGDGGHSGGSEHQRSRGAARRGRRTDVDSLQPAAEG